MTEQTKGLEIRFTTGNRNKSNLRNKGSLAHMLVTCMEAYLNKKEFT